MERLRTPLISGAAARPREVAAVALAGAAAWVVLLWLLRGSSMGMGMGSTMGLSILAFLGAWTLMMAAMMLPAVSPVAALYARSIERSPGGGPAPARLAQFVLGYLAVWAAIGLPAFVVALAVDAIAMAAPGAVRWGVVAVLVALAAYQLTPLKQLCLRHCRSPLSHLLAYWSYSGPARDFRVGSHHGLYCAGCCWPLFLLLVAVGTMNLGAMLALTAVIAAEKLLPHGIAVSRAVAAVALLLAVAIAVSPELFTRVTSI
jgi:predicted metal-binding membrane protein